MDTKGSQTRAIEILADDNEEKLEPGNYPPIVGKVAAGVPITAIENIDGYASVS